MPMAAVIQQANQALTAEAVQTLQSGDSRFLEELGQKGGLASVAQSHLGLSDENTRYIASIPSSVQEAIRSAIHDAVSNGRAVHLTFKPGYDFGAEVWEFGDAVGVQLTGPYTGAAFPREGFTAG
jgi:hypothetical protein